MDLRLSSSPNASATTLLGVIPDLARYDTTNLEARRGLGRVLLRSKPSRPRNQVPDWVLKHAMRPNRPCTFVVGDDGS